MNTQLHIEPTDAASAPSLAGAARKVVQRVVQAIETCADYAAAAALYEHLSHLSDAELKRRGLSRESLGRDVCAACDRTNRAR